METIVMAFMIMEGNVFGATVAAAFVLLLWMLGIGLIVGKNLMAMNHASLCRCGWYCTTIMRHTLG